MSDISSGTERKNGVSAQRQHLLFAAVSISFIVVTFVLAVSAISLVLKAAAFTAILIGFAAAAFLFFRRIGEMWKEETAAESTEETDDADGSETEEKLTILDEAGRFFSASLKSDDMFRLVSSRIEEIIPHKSSVLFMVGENGRLDASYAAGEHARALTKITLECDQGIAGRAFISEEVEFDASVGETESFIEKEILSGFSSAMAISLKRGVETFGILVLYGSRNQPFVEQDTKMLEAVAERVAPLLASSFSFEQNISNAMVDSLTKLPNERAFYLVLETQIAEAQRFQEQRPLTILTIDIKEFAEFNRLYGHSTGDSLLAFASDIIKGQLRKMDFLCRSMNDEFWVVLPTASDEITESIVDRLRVCFEEQPFELPGEKEYFAELNFGSASFLRDGETTNQLLQTALLRKKEEKSGEESSVIMFPREYVN